MSKALVWTVLVVLGAVSCKTSGSNQSNLMGKAKKYWSCTGDNNAAARIEFSDESTRSVYLKIPNLSVGDEELALDKEKNTPYFVGFLHEFEIRLQITEPDGARWTRLDAQRGGGGEISMSCTTSDASQFMKFAQPKVRSWNILCRGESIVEDPGQSNCDFEQDSICYTGSAQAVFEWLSTSRKIGRSNDGSYTILRDVKKSSTTIRFSGNPKNAEGMGGSAFDGKISPCS